MGLWNGSSIDSAETALVFNKLYNLKSIDHTRRRRGLMYAALGVMVPAKTPMDRTSFENLKSVTGRKVEVKILGKLFTPNFTTDGSAELQTVDLASAHATDYWGAMEFDIAHITWTHPIPASQLDRYEGKELKTLRFIDEVNTLIERSYEGKRVGPGLHGATAPARDNIGGWQWAVSDGVSSGETAFDAYGTINRSDSGNADFRSYVEDVGGNGKLRHIRKAVNKCIANHGNPRIALVDEDGYTHMEGLLEPYVTVDYDEEWSRFGSRWIEYKNLKYIMDVDTPDQTMGIIDPDYVVYYMSKKPFTRSGIVEDISRVDAYVVKTKVWIQQLFTCLNVHAKLKNFGFA